MRVSYGKTRFSQQRRSENGPRIRFYRDREEVAALLGNQPDLPGDRPRSETEILCAGHVPLPLRGGASRRPSRGVHRHRHRLPLPADEGVQRAPSDGVGRLRTACGTVRGRNRHPSGGHHPQKHRQFPPPDQIARLQLRLGPRNRHHQSRLFQVDSVDLHAAPQKRTRLPR